MILSIRQQLQLRALEISREYKLSHLSSVLPAIDIMTSTDPGLTNWILSNGHAGLAQYVYNEYYMGVNAVDMFLDMGIHPERDPNRGILVTTGSLGLGLPIAAGLAFSNRSVNYNVIISDGEAMEGSIWESLNFIRESNLSNLKVMLQCNGQGAYNTIDTLSLSMRLAVFLPSIIIKYYDTSFTSNIDTHYWHYKSPSDEEFEKLKELIYEDSIKAISLR